MLVGKRALNPTGILAVGVDLPLSEPGAVMLAAKVRLDAPKAAAQALVDGSPYDRALLLGQLSAADRQVLRALLTTWSGDVPGAVGQRYRDALAALSVP